jgi:hypothetical protein
LDAAFEEMIAVSYQISDVLSRVTDAASAKAAAPKYVSLSGRKNELLREMAGLKLQLGDEGDRIAQKYSSRVKVAAESATAAEARVWSNRQIVITWGKALEAAMRASAPAPTPPPATGQGGADSPAQQFVALQREMVDNIRQVVDLLSSVNDEASARAAAPKLRQCASEMQRVGKRIKLAMASLSRQDLQRAFAELEGSIEENAELGSRMDDEIIRVAAGPAGGTVQAEINDLLNALESVHPGKRQRLERDIQRAGGGR